MAVKIKLMRLGKIRTPHYRIVVADSRTRRNGRAIETIGKYHPKEEPSFIEVDSERAQYWLGVGALPTEPVETLLKITGDWQKFKGLPGTEGTLRTKEVGASRLELFQAALAQAGDEPSSAATTPKKKLAKKVDTETAESDTAKPDAEKADATKPDTAAAAGDDTAAAGDDTAAAGDDTAAAGDDTAAAGDDTAADAK